MCLSISSSSCLYACLLCKYTLDPESVWMWAGDHQVCINEGFPTHSMKQQVTVGLAKCTRLRRVIGEIES